MKIEKDIPIFPLPVYLLPEGITRLRIFEPRYVKMVKIATKEQGFVIVSRNFEENQNENVWGSWVDIINFDQSKGGLLEIDVKCKSLVKVLALSVDEDKLHFGDVEQISHWSQNNKGAPETYLSQSLETLFINNPLLNELYQKKLTSNPQWVMARWLELLPISGEIKNEFIFSQNFEEAKFFVQSIISK
ncbi:LON peptidase substrate-binding domain-containing protein [Thalassotalea piscium]